jgi:hypothetical protein
MRRARAARVGDLRSLTPPSGDHVGADGWISTLHVIHAARPAIVGV